MRLLATNYLWYTFQAIPIFFCIQFSQAHFQIVFSLYVKRDNKVAHEMVLEAIVEQASIDLYDFIDYTSM